MVDSVAHLVDEVLSKRPIRQWVLGVLYPLRYLFATTPTVVTCGKTYLVTDKKIWLIRPTPQQQEIPVLSVLFNAQFDGPMNNGDHGLMNRRVRSVGESRPYGFA